MGDVMISIILEDYGLTPELSPMSDTVLVTIFDEESTFTSYRYAQMLRDGGIKATVYPEPAKLLKQFKYADRNGIGFALVVGPDEVAKQQVAIKNLKTREQISVLEQDLIKEINDLLA